jgi:hypothetical protein
MRNNSLALKRDWAVLPVAEVRRLPLDFDEESRIIQALHEKVQSTGGISV